MIDDSVDVNEAVSRGGASALRCGHRTARNVVSSRGIAELAAASGILLTGLAIVTWPYATVLTTGLPDSIDPMFSIWRLSWFAHAVRSHLPVANANIFYPEPGTFAYSDTIFLLDSVAAPLLWAGVNKVLVYNVLLLGGFVTSGVALFMAAREVDVPFQAAVVGAAIFTLAPYRLEHLIHLELQWLPGSVAAIVSTVLLAVRPSFRAGLALSGSLVLQFLTSIYYAIFLLPLLGSVWLCCLPIMPQRWRTVRLTLLGGVLAAVLISPVVSLHLQQRDRLGGRHPEEVQMFSATASDYLATPDENLLYGRRTDGTAANERRLFPGGLAVALATAGLFSRRRRVVAICVVCTALAVELSLGTNGTLYSYLYRWLTPWQGLRAPSRYGAFVLLGISVLAALGWERLLNLRSGAKGLVAPGDTRRVFRTRLLTSLVLGALCVEYLSPPRLWNVGATPSVYAMIRLLPPGVILEYPTPSSDSIPWIDADYAFWSTTHWRPLVNGYSGYLPASFWARAERFEQFPSDATLAESCALNVRYVVVHPWAIQQPRRVDVLERLALREELKHLGSFSDWQATAQLFELSPAACGVMGSSHRPTSASQ